MDCAGITPAPSPPSDSVFCLHLIKATKKIELLVQDFLQPASVRVGMNAFVPALYLAENWRTEITAGTVVCGVEDTSCDLSFLVKAFQWQYFVEEEKWG